MIEFQVVTMHVVQKITLQEGVKSEIQKFLEKVANFQQTLSKNDEKL